MGMTWYQSPALIELQAGKTSPPQNPDTTERQESDLLTSLQIRHDPSMLIRGGSFCIYRTDQLPTYDSVQHIIDHIGMLLQSL